ncbi:MAG: Uma2 family endonuclease [Pyrinomonadaceae bacterium]
MISTTATTTTQKLEVWGYPGMEVDLGSVRTFSDEEFLEFCRRNPDARIERDSNGEIILMAPAHTETGGMNANLSYFVTEWTRRDGTGRAFESSTGFTLPNGALRSPDASWISFRRWNALSDKERFGFAKICPDFVVELRSTSDSLSKIRAKMTEYMENGAALGWLIDPTERKVYIYKPDQQEEVLDNPAQISGEPLMKGFVLNPAEVWG